MEVRRDQSCLIEMRSPLAEAPVTESGMVMYPQRTPVKPPFLENERNSRAQSCAPSIS